jgi:hypothetical protein
MTETEKIAYVNTIGNMTTRLSYYGDADVLRISFYKLVLKYRGYLDSTQVDENNESKARVIARIMKRIEVDCSDLVRQ